jgi:predicted Zn finger-like uncharacterized protein
MSVRIACPKCSASYGVSEVFVGRQARCKKCGHTFSLSGTIIDESAIIDLDREVEERSEPQIDQVFANRYKIEKKLGAGGMGSVFRARDQDLGRLVALKVPHFRLNEDPEIVRRFEREARVAAGFDHPNLCPVYDVGKFEGVRYLTMPFIDGDTLSTIIRSGHLDQTRAAQIANTIAVALAEAHAKGVIHRDLKPSNVLMHPKRGPVVVDFGLARNDSHDDSRLTRTGTLLGTPAYMAPEQVDGDQRAIGPRTDVYALGVLLYEMLTGRPPFEGNVSSILVRIKMELPRHPKDLRPDLQPELGAIALKAMAKGPADRQSSMDELSTELGTWLDAHDSSRLIGRIENSASRLRRPSWLARVRPSRRMIWSVVRTAISLVLLAVIGFAVWKATDRGTVRLVVGDPTAIQMLLIDGKKVPNGELASPISIRSGDHELEISLASGNVTQVFSVKRWQETSLPISAVQKPKEAPDTGDTKSEDTPGESPSTPPTNPGEISTTETPSSTTSTHLDPDPDSSALTTGAYAGDLYLLQGLGLTMRWCPPGTFTMGSPADEPDRDGDEGPVEVTLTNGFWLGETEVTQAQYERLTDTRPSFFSSVGDGSSMVTDLDTSEFPVESVSWDEAVEFCDRLTALEHLSGRLPYDWEYRLPTEAQWEYACRAGSTTATSFGSQLDSTQANFDGSLPYNGASTDASIGRPTAVGRYATNAWDLRDMHGNVAEWCRDSHVWSLPGGTDPIGPPLKTDLVRRGGAWSTPGSKCRSSYRMWEASDYKSNFVGFRIAAVRPGEEPEPSPPTSTLSEGSFAGESWSDNGLELTMRWCPSGSFTMGSPSDEPERDTDEGPVEVELSTGFWFAATEITQAQYERIMGTNPSYYSSTGGGSDSVVGIDTTDYPVESMSWAEANEFCENLTTHEREAGRLAEGWIYRLPTEAQWEYACRARTSTATTYGNQLDSSQANFDGNYPYNGADVGEYLSRPTHVASYASNDWSIYDVHGNVSEWCLDTYSPVLTEGVDPIQSLGTSQVTRGGNWFNTGRSCRSAYRSTTEAKDNTIGIRVILERQ